MGGPEEERAGPRGEGALRLIGQADKFVTTYSMDYVREAPRAPVPELRRYEDAGRKGNIVVRLIFDIGGGGGKGPPRVLPSS